MLLDALVDQAGNPTSRIGKCSAFLCLALAQQEGAECPSNRILRVKGCYDTLHRATGASYSNGDPSLTFTYDGTSCLNLPTCQNIGHRTSMTDGAGSESCAYQVDKINSRNIHQEQRTTNSSPNNITKTTTYYLDLAGNVTKIVYPTGRTVNYTPPTGPVPPRTAPAESPTPLAGRRHRGAPTAQQEPSATRRKAASTA